MPEEYDLPSVKPDDLAHVTSTLALAAPAGADWAPMIKLSIVNEE